MFTPRVDTGVPKMSAPGRASPHATRYWLPSKAADGWCCPAAPSKYEATVGLGLYGSSAPATRCGWFCCPSLQTAKQVFKVTSQATSGWPTGRAAFAEAFGSCATGVGSGPATAVEKAVVSICPPVVQTNSYFAPSHERSGSETTLVTPRF